MLRLSKFRIERALRMVKDISLYIHIPFCRTKCGYCTFFSLPNPGKEVIREYIGAIRHDISWVLKTIPPNSLSTLYIGGGTPSFLSEEIFSILNTIDQEVQSNQQGCEERTLEVNPQDGNKDFLIRLRETGINRLSVGIQSTREELLQIIGRGTSRNATEKALGNLRDFWDRKLSLDLLGGIPGQTESTMKDDFVKMLEALPEHVSLYQLSFEEGTPLYKRAAEGQIGDDWSPEFLESLQLYGESVLEGLGYHHYEVSSFSRSPADVSKHNMRYWNMRPYIGIGPSAGSTLPDPDRPGFPLRLEFPDDIASWLEKSKVDEPGPYRKVRGELLQGRTFLFEYLLMHLRTFRGISKSDFFHCFGSSFKDLLPNGFKHGQEKGYILDKEDRYYVTKLGLHFLNSFLMELLEEIQKVSYLPLSWPDELASEQAS